MNVATTTPTKTKRRRMTKRVLFSTDKKINFIDEQVAKANRARYIKKVLSTNFDDYCKMSLALDLASL